MQKKVVYDIYKKLPDGKETPVALDIDDETTACARAFRLSQLDKCEYTVYPRVIEG